MGLYVLFWAHSLQARPMKWEWSHCEDKTRARGPESYTPQVEQTHIMLLSVQLNSFFQHAFFVWRPCPSCFLSLCLYLLAEPWPVQVAIPLSVGTDSAQVYVQRPQLGLVDGVKVCVCQGVCNDACDRVCEYRCDWHSLYPGTRTVTLSNLSPGSEYQMRVYSTSREQTGPPYYAQPFRTSELPGLIKSLLDSHTSITLTHCKCLQPLTSRR